MTPVTALSGVILAGGLSCRMGELKPLLPIGGTPTVLRCVETFTDIGVDPVVVLGFAAERIAEVLEGAGARYAVNPDYRRGMYSSVLTGLAAAGEVAEWTAILPVDAPLVRAETVGSLVRAGADRVCDVVHPSHAGRRGHPPLLRAAARRAVLRDLPQGGLREVLKTLDDRAFDVPVGDPAILIDMDDRGDHALVVELARVEGIPSADECLRLLERRGVEVSVRAHCLAVARVARALGRALNETGACLNLRLLGAAALLHDLARGRPDHAAEGAVDLAAEGLPRVAAVVARHMDTAEPRTTIPGEADVLYLSDKLVQDETVVPIERRLAVVSERFAGDDAALGAARRRLEVAARLASRVEGLTGRPLQRLLS